MNRRDFKKGVSMDDNRRRREANSVKLRKEKKEEGLAKRRNLLIDNFMDNTNSSQVDGTMKKTYSINDIPELMQGMQNVNDPSQQLKCLRGFRRLLSVEKNPPVQQCLDCGALPYFVRFLQGCSNGNVNAELQFEAAWALTNIASTEYTRKIVEAGSIPYLVQLLSSPHPEVRDQSAWCLGNVAGDSSDLRDIVLKNGGMEPLLANIQQPANTPLLRNCTWTLSNFCRGKPQPSLDIIGSAIPILANLLKNSSDQETIVDATWALSYISDGDDKRIQAVVSQGVTPILVNMLKSNQNHFVVPALRTLGNIASGNDQQTQAVLDAGVLPALVPLIDHTKTNVRKETCWMISNIAAGSFSQMSSLFNISELLPRVIGQLSSSAEWNVRKEAVWVVSNIATSGNENQIMRLVEFGVLPCLCEMLGVGDPKILMITMEALESILKSGDSSDGNIYAKVMDEAGGIDGLEKLQEHENIKIYEKAVSIIEKFFGAEDEESENLAPTFTSNEFNFGIQTTGKSDVDFGAGFIHANSNQFTNFSF